MNPFSIEPGRRLCAESGPIRVADADGADHGFAIDAGRRSSDWEHQPARGAERWILLSVIALTLPMRCGRFALPTRILAGCVPPFTISSSTVSLAAIGISHLSWCPSQTASPTMF